jgi:hypothetical protein
MTNTTIIILKTSNLVMNKLCYKTVGWTSISSVVAVVEMGWSSQYSVTIEYDESDLISIFCALVLLFDFVALLLVNRLADNMQSIIKMTGLMNNTAQIIQIRSAMNNCVSLLVGE